MNGTEHSAEMAEGMKSQFDVFIDEELAFSKQRDGRFAEVADVLAALTSATS